MNELEAFQKELAEKNLVIEGLEAELRQKAQEAHSFVAKTLGIDPSGKVSIEAVLNLIVSVLKLKETQCEASK